MFEIFRETSVGWDFSGERAMMRFLILGVLGCGILAGFLYATPPLKTVPVQQTEFEAMTRFLSQPAQAGATAFADQCSSCHGLKGQGSGDAPSLTERDYAKDFRDAEAFHDSVGRAAAAHSAARTQKAKSSRQSFNELELMGKFLRELRVRNERES